VDGTYGIVRQLSLDTVGVAAVAVEGLLPPKETRNWPTPKHRIKLIPVEHQKNTSLALSGLMFSYELELASKAPHRVVFLDGSFTTILIKTGQVLNHLPDFPSALRSELDSRLYDTLKNFLTILMSPRVDISYVGVPKYTTRNEILSLLMDRGFSLPIMEKIDDKGLLSIALEPGDVVGPISLSKPGEWHITLGEKDLGKEGEDPFVVQLANQIVNAMFDLYVLYFKPYPHQPAFRLEISKSIAENPSRIGVILEAVQAQTGIPGVFEPYPLYIADQFVKHAYFALSELKDAVLPSLDEVIDVSPDTILSFHAYRSEGGYE
jgi:hypothetical protein